MTEFGPLPFDISSLHPATPLQQLRAQVQRLQQNQHPSAQFVCGSAVLERVSGLSEAMQRSEDKQLELFCFDNCKTHCSSSRLHLGSRLILVMLFPGNITSFSEPFELLSKKPRKKKKDLNTAGEPEDPTKQEVAVIQIPTAITLVPSIALPGRPQGAVNPIEPQQPGVQSQPAMKSSLMDIAAAAVAEEEREANANSDTKQETQEPQQQHLTPKQKKARLRDFPNN